MDKNEKHLDVYEERYELHQNGKTLVYYQGLQNKETQKRYVKINQILTDGYLEKLYDSVQRTNFSGLTEKNRNLLCNIVDGVTSEVGRALVGLTFLQLTIKSIAPNQSIRLHKGTMRKGSFSWVDGISMRTIDSTYITPFLREHELLNLNKYGLFMTRSLAENYPYSSLYKAEMRGSFNEWIMIVDAIEDGTMPAEQGLLYMMSLLRNRSDKFKKNADLACNLVSGCKEKSFDFIEELILEFVDNTEYSARAFEVAIHSFFQAMGELHYLSDAEVVPISQMRSANKKHGNVGDIELAENGVIFEAWDAKYGKPYLRDELEELRDKLLKYPGVITAGFVVDTAVDMRKDIAVRKKDIEMETGTQIFLFSFNEWIKYETGNLTIQQKSEIGYRWIFDMVESFARKRLRIAPIDEPCDAWIEDLINILQKC